MHILPLVRTLNRDLYAALRANPRVFQLDPTGDTVSLAADPLTRNDKGAAVAQLTSNHELLALR